MIREFRDMDTEAVMSIWLNSNIEAHPFVKQSYWESNYQTVQEQLLQAEVYVCEKNGEVQGFIGLMDRYIAGVFVDGKQRGRGVGKKLLDYAKGLYDTLSLSVYAKNERAKVFYLREGFVVSAEGIEVENSELEYTMTWEETDKIPEIVRLREHKGRMEQASKWFSSKWGVTQEAYRENMKQCTGQITTVPQWYLILNDQEEIIAGAGVIENDFHNRKDLSPNLCALFVEKAYRNQGIARKLLDFVREDMCRMGVEKLYLVTDHTEFYEKCGWGFLTMVRDDEGYPERMYVAETRKYV